MRRTHTHHEIEIIEDEDGFAVVLLGARFSTLKAAREAIDAYLAKPKEIVIETVERSAAEAVQADNGIPLPDPQPARRSRLRR